MKNSNYPQGTRTSDEHRIEVQYTIEKRDVNVNSLLRKNVIYGHNVDFPSSLPVFNVQKSH